MSLSIKSKSAQWAERDAREGREERERKRGGAGQTTASMSCQGCDKVSFPSALLRKPPGSWAWKNGGIYFSFLPPPSLLLCCFLLVAPFPCAFFHGFRFCDVVPRARKLQAHNKYFVLRFLSSFLLLSFSPLSLPLLFLKYLLQIFACFLLFLNLHSYFFTLLCPSLLFFFFFSSSSLLPSLSSSSCFSFCKYCVAYLHKVLRECFL